LVIAIDEIWNLIIFYLIFWICFFLLVYPYTFYPLLLVLFSKFKKNNFKYIGKGGHQPLVTIIISAYNEENIIKIKLENTFQLDYPKDKLEVMVVSDASTDKTDDIVKQWSTEYSNLKLVRQQQRFGKTSGLNLAVPKANGEVIIFSDANAIYDRNSINELVKYFKDPNVGYVMGAALYNANKDPSSKSEGLYWKFELFVKKLETKFYSVVGGDGAIYAIRKELFWKLDRDDINDFVNPLQIVAKNYKGVFNPKAICFEDSAGDFNKEFKRKRRIVNRSWRAVKKYFWWFDFKKHYKFVFELFSHKIIRWFSLPILLIALFVNLFIITKIQSPFYLIIFTGQIVFWILTFLGIVYNRLNMEMPKVIYLSYYYSFIHTAALLGIIDETRGIKHTTWDHIRDN
jgi:cellulose synthase/poly-beta-1,6-N-acetylglucosamine synthase-like glycosyltransferase